MHDPLLRARKDALKALEDSLTDDEYEIAIRAIDVFFDFIEEEVPSLTHLQAEDGTKVHELFIDTNCLNCEKLDE